jgi:hypothetical protein
METFKFKNGGGERLMNSEDKKGRSEVVVFSYFNEHKKSDYSVYWGVDVDSAKARFLESGSVKEDGVTEASVLVLWLKDELHIHSNAGDLLKEGAPAWARHLFG